MANGSTVPSVAQLLMESARQDVAVCNLLSPNTSIGDAVIGFHAQQAIEKSIKAVLSQSGIEFRRTHDLIDLLDLVQDNGLPMPPHADWLDELNPYAVEARYGTIGPDTLDHDHVLKVIAAVSLGTVGSGRPMTVPSPALASPSGRAAAAGPARVRWLALARAVRRGAAQCGLHDAPARLPGCPLLQTCLYTRIFEAPPPARGQLRRRPHRTSVRSPTPM